MQWAEGHQVQRKEHCGTVASDNVRFAPSHLCHVKQDTLKNKNKEYLPVPQFPQL